MAWTRFMDMHSGGGQKLDWDKILIEAPEDEARAVFYNRFGRNPDRVTCTCCGEDYSVSESETLEDATAYDRHCRWDKDGETYVEEQDPKHVSIRSRCNTPPQDPWGLYMTLDTYLAKESVLVIRANEIKDDERTADIPDEGYVWAGD
jgi:hypothetical protein